MANDFIRQSQLVTTYGPGSMIDLPDYSVMVSGLDEWAYQRRERIDEPRLVAKLRRLLSVPALDLYTPPRHEENADSQAPVGVRIFPTWFIVRKSYPSPRNSQWRRRRLVQWSNLSNRRFVDEDGSRNAVVSVRFVCGCKRGHIDDLNWRGFIHISRNNCQRPLWLEERGTSGDITDTLGVCDCGEERPLYEALGVETNALGRCHGRRPWIGQYATEECDETYRLLVRTASNAYFPQLLNVISLPEFDAVLAAKVANQLVTLRALNSVGMLASFRNSPELGAVFEGVSDEAVIAEFGRQEGGGESVDIPVKVAEFAILNKGDALIGEDDARSKFHAETISEWGSDPVGDQLCESVDKVVLVHRLREVVSLLGFTRFESSNPDREGELDLDVIRASLADSVTWLPTVENRGEGLFLSFKPERIQAWLVQPGVKSRGGMLETGWKLWAE